MASIKIDCGGAGGSGFSADAYFSGGDTFTGDPATVSGTLVDPMTSAGYSTVRYGSFTYTVPGSTASANRPLRLHFNTWNNSSLRFNVTVNGVAIRTNWHPRMEGAAFESNNQAVIVETTQPANSSGQYVVAITSITGFGLLSGIEINDLVVDNTKPSNVTNLTANKINNGQIDINSDAATDNIAVTGYLTERRINEGAWGALTPTTKAFSDTENLPTAPGTYSVEYRRKAFDAAGNLSLEYSAITPPVSITILPPPPTAAFSLPATVIINQAFTPENLSTGSPTSYAWDKENDGVTDSTAFEPSFSFSTLGTKTVKLTALNSGGSDIETHTIEVVAEPPPTPLIISPTPLPYARSGFPFTYQFQVQGGSGSGIFQINVQGNLPVNAINNAGLLNIPLVGDNDYSFILDYLDANGTSYTKAFSIPVSDLAYISFCHKRPLKRRPILTITEFETISGRDVAEDAPLKYEYPLQVMYSGRDKGNELRQFFEDRRLKDPFLWHSPDRDETKIVTLESYDSEEEMLSHGGFEVVLRDA